MRRHVVHWFDTISSIGGSTIVVRILSSRGRRSIVVPADIFERILEESKQYIIFNSPPRIPNDFMRHALVLLEKDSHVSRGVDSGVHTSTYRKGRLLKPFAGDWSEGVSTRMDFRWERERSASAANRWKENCEWREEGYGRITVGANYPSGYGIPNEYRLIVGIFSSFSSLPLSWHRSYGHAPSLCCRDLPSRGTVETGKSTVDDIDW